MLGEIISPIRPNVKICMFAVPLLNGSKLGSVGREKLLFIEI